MKAVIISSINERYSQAARSHASYSDGVLFDSRQGV